jgi:hypothetical protein
LLFLRRIEVWDETQQRALVFLTMLKYLQLRCPSVSN